MNKFQNEVSLAYLSSVVVNESNSKSQKVSPFEVSMLNIDMAQYGYTLGADVIARLHTLSVYEANVFASTVQKILNELKRTDIKSVPLFKRFPYNNEMSDKEYFEKRVSGYTQSFLNQFVQKKERANHTMLSCGHLIDNNQFNLQEFGACPICQMHVDGLDNPATDLPKFKHSATALTVLSLSTSADVFEVFKNIVGSQLAYSVDFKNTITGFFKNYGANLKGILPRTIKVKENAAYISAHLFAVNGKKAIPYIKGYINTATDVLRLAVAFSGGDVSLAENTDYKLTSAQRKLVLSLLENVSTSLEEDVLRNKESWLRLGKTLHVGAYKSQYPKSFGVINQIRTNPSAIETFNSKLELEIANNKSHGQNLGKLLELLKQRPGVFGRSLDLVLRENAKESVAVLEAFESVIEHVSTNVLLSVSKHIEKRNDGKKRLYIPKGNVLTMKFGEASQGTISKDSVQSVLDMVSKEVSSRFATRERFENVYIDPSIEKLIVPFAMRANSEGVLNMTRGSRIKISDDTDVVGMFINWKNTSGGDIVDLDLSAVFLDEDFNYVSSVSYSGYNSGETGAYYSGDVQSGGGKHGGYEGINIALNDFGSAYTRSKGSRYVAMSVISYHSHAFNQFESVVGFQEREALKGGDAYEASAVKTKFAVSGSGRSCVPMIFDLETREVIWVDAHLTSKDVSFRNIHSDSEGICNIVKAFVEMKDRKMSMKELMDLHSDRFGKIDYVRNPETEYDLVIDQEFALNLPEVVAKWL